MGLATVGSLVTLVSLGGLVDLLRRGVLGCLQIGRFLSARVLAGSSIGGPDLRSLLGLGDFLSVIGGAVSTRRVGVVIGIGRDGVLRWGRG